MAFSLNRVPQVGQIFGVWLEFSGVIVFLQMLQVLEIAASFHKSFASLRDCDILT